MSVTVSSSGGGGSAADLRTATFIVGSAPAGDTADMVDYLDDGTGAGLYAAVAAATVAGVGRVYVRRGDYPIGGDVLGALVVAGSLILQGEGDGTRLVFPASGQMLSLQVQGAIMDLFAGYIGSGPTGALDDGGGGANRFVEIQGSARAFNCTFAAPATAGTVGNYPSFWSVVRMLGGDGGLLESCRLSAYSSVQLAAGSESICVAATGVAALIKDCSFGNPGSVGLVDVAAEIGEGSLNRIQGLRAYNTNTIGVRLVGVFTNILNGIDDSLITNEEGVAIGTLIFNGVTLALAFIRGISIFSAAGASGVSIITAVGETADGMCIHDCQAQGQGGGGVGIEMNDGGVGVGAITNGSMSLNRATGYGTNFILNVAASGPVQQVGNAY